MFKSFAYFFRFFSAALVCAFKSLPNGEYSNLLIPADFSNKSFFGKTPLPVKSSNLQTYPYDKAEILRVCLSTLYQALFCSIFY